MFKLLITHALLMVFLPTLVLADVHSLGARPAQHNVVRATAPPTIDGIISANEWGTLAQTECSPSDPMVDCNVADKWVDLRQNTEDTHNLRFQMQWDDTHLYILGRSDYRPITDVPGFVEGIETENVANAPNDPDWNGTGYAASFYFDPNQDEERDWDPMLPVAPDTVDGYQITWDINQGFSSRAPTVGKPEQSLRDPLNESGESINDYFGGMRLEAHVNAAFGNDGAWDLDSDGPNTNYRDDAFPGLTFAQYAYNEDDPETTEMEEPGAVWEWAIPWAIFNASDPDRLVTAEDEAARPEMIVDTRRFIFVEHPDDPDLMQRISNPKFGETVLNEGQIPGVDPFIGNAGDADARFADEDSPLFLENGLFAPEGPKAGDVWGFETSVFTNDFTNSLPSWSEPIGGDPTRGDLFSLWGTLGHGQITFLAEGKTGFEPDPDTCMVPEGFLPGDLDQSSSVGFADFLILSGNFGEENVGYSGGDIDCDGTVAFSDFLTLSGNFGKSTENSVATVPEPSQQPFLLVASLFVLFTRRHRQR